MYGLGPMELLEEFALIGLGLVGADDDSEVDDDEDDLDDDDNNTGDDDGDGDDSDDDDADDKSKKSKKDDEDDPAAGLKRNNQRLLDQRKIQRRKIKDLEEQIEKLQSKDEDGKTDSDKLAEADKKIATLGETITAMRLENAFLRDNAYEWHDSKVALSMLDLDDLDIDEETGEVEGLADALKKLATDHPYLVKQPEKRPDPKKSGDASGGRKKQSKTVEAERQAALRAKYNL